MEYGVYIGGATLATAIIAYVVRITFWVTQIDKEAREYMDAQIDNLQRDVIRFDRNSADRADIIRHEFGETGAAIRQKIHEVETWSRDTFVRKESFEQALRRIESSMDKAVGSMNKTVDRIDARVEAMFNHMKST